ncbi:MAG TPA: SDR family NAD(P)-dependent oxidoreductase, partial [Pyrinomonadaceae bacterium]|nr:SDR family NAD(P)-dependent oxidoreductase [Pyrinomonadaceae bacterium]
LSGNVREILKHRSIEGAAVSSLHRDEDERSTLHKGLAVLHCSGQPVRFASLYPKGGRVVSLPAYAWQRDRHWLPEPSSNNGDSVAKASAAVSTTASPNAVNASANNSARLYFHNGWEKASLNNSSATANAPGSILILGANEDMLKNGRTALAATKSPIVLVQPGDAYRELGGLRYEINPQQSEHYRQLIQSLAQSNLMPGRIIYCWSTADVPNTESEIKSELDHSVYSILYLTQALLEAKPAHAIRLWYVFATTANQVLPQHAALSGSFKNVRQENPQLIFKTLEIRNATGTTSGGLWELMSREINFEGNNEFEVRYENDSRYARCLKEVELEDKAQPAKHLLPVKKDGVYLITGGAGGLGLLFAEHLARQERVKLVLTGRSSLSANKTAQIERLKTFGAEVVYLQNDVSQRDQAVALVNQIRSRFGTVNGVLHVAGNLDRSFVGKKQPEGVAAILGPKVYGTIHLDDVLKNEPLDFFVFFSSISAVKGYEGLFDYAYGNSFMDHFAELRESLRCEQRRFGRSISINWSLWQDGGMQLAQDEAALFLEQTGLEVLKLAEGGKLFDVCATQDQVHQCLVGFGDREKFAEFLNPPVIPVEPVNQRAVNTAADCATEAQAVDEGLLREKVAAYLTGKLAEVTGLPAEEFDPQERFVTYGIDSVIVHRFNAKLAKDLGPVSKTLLFENKNIDELANYFATHHTAVLTKLLGLQVAPTAAVEVQPSSTLLPAVAVTVEAPVVTKVETRVEIKVEQPLEVTVPEQEIAIIGVSGRYPHANNLEEFWQNLSSGRDCIGEIRSDRWDYRNYYDPDLNAGNEGKTYTKWAGLVDDVEKFDPLFFNLSVKEAESMDPQERLLLEMAWTAFEDAGYSRKRLRSYVQDSNGIDVGVFVGCTSNTHMMLGPAEWEAGNHTLPLSMPWSLANRVSHVLDLHGPSLPVDTGCASSLTAIHLACESLKGGECSMALAGGVNLMLHPSKFLYPTKYRMLSPTGRCRAFGRDADGIVIGEGVGAVVLKRLRDAVRDGDHIYAVIKGTASNHGGQVNGYTVPSPQAQAKLILQSLNSANVDARTVSCIEAHGTGTALGDPIEVAGLTKAFREYTPDKQFCTLGSLKSNIGHLEGAAGIAGLTKMLLQMKHQQFVPSLHVEQPNPDIDFEASPFCVRSELAEWQQPVISSNGESRTFPRRAGISSFGAGGSNAHVLIEEYVDQTPSSSAPDDSCLLLLSARSEERLTVYAQRMADFVERTYGDTKEAGDGPILADLAYTLQVGREPLEERLAVIVGNHGELVEALRAFVENRVSHTAVRRGSTGKSTISAGERKELKENLADWLKRGQLSLLSEAWLKGLDVDWKQMPQNSRRRIVSLPTYPFLKERVWIHDRAVLCEPPKRVPTSLGQQSLHPLVDSNESTLSEERFRKLLNGSEFFLRDHRVGDHLVLPGVAIVEMARAAGQMAAERRVTKIKNIVFSSPVSIAAEPKAFFVGLQPDDAAVDFQVYSLDENGQRDTHTQGKLVYEPLEQVEDSEWIDIDGIRQRCQSTVESAAGYKLLHELGLQLGPSFQSVGTIFYSDVEAFSRLELPAHLHDTFDEFVLHPSLMDGAQQVTGLTSLLGKEDRVRVPFAVGEIEVLGRLTPVCYAHVRLIGGREALNSAHRKFDISLADETGRVLVNIKRFQTRDFVNRPAETRSTSSSAAASEPFYFQEKWEPAPVGPSKNAAIGTVLLFDTGDQLRDALRARLQAESNGRVNVVLVKPGRTFRSFGEQGYTIDPQSSADYERLFEGLKGRDRMPDSIVHLWSRESFSNNTEMLNDQLTSSVYSIFSVVQRLLQHNPLKQTQLLYGFSSSDEAPQPQYAALRGFAATAQKESPKLSCKSLEFRGPLASSNSGSDDAMELARILVSELLCDDASLEILYQHGTRYAHSFHEADVSRTAGETQLKNQGVYLLTGGLGGLGLLFAEYLAQNFKARLVLTGRSDIDANQQAKLDSLRNRGAEVIYLRADVSRRTDVDALVNDAKARFGHIDGVIHCAGTTHDALVRNKTRDDIKRVFAPKVFGTINLDEALANEPLDFFVTFSSTTALLGQVGLSDYGYANRFMDHFASWRESQRSRHNRSGKSVSINWPLWRDGGMGLNAQGEELLFTQTGMKAMSTHAGIEAFERALAVDGNQLFVIAGDRNRIHKTLNLVAAAPAAVSLDHRVEEKPTTSGSSLPALQQLQKDLVKTVSAVLKIAEARISLDKNVSDYGFDSVSLVEFSNRLNRKYHLEITPTIFFEYPSLNAFAKYLLDEHSDAIASHFTVAETQPAPARPTVPAQTSNTTALVSRLRPAAPVVQASPVVHEAPRQAENVTYATNTKEPIAIIGMCGIMPQSEDLDAFWRHLEAGDDLVTEIPSDRWDWKAYFGNPAEEANKTNIKWGGFINDVDKFDARFFGISRREAEFMDPQQRIFLETVWKAIEDAGYKPSELAGQKVGVFAGVAGLDYGELMRDNGIEIEPYSTTGVFHCIVANRVSYLLNLTGPSVPVDTGCSSALVAIRQAIEGIWTGSCDMAIAGGVNALLSPSVFIAFSKAGMLSADGRCKTFDKGANGYVRAEGSGVLLLKPLSKAIADRDNIHAIIRGSAINHGGRVNTLTAPNPNAQAELIQKAFAEGDVDPTTVSYIEAHGTGTALGDPIEINGLKKAFRKMLDKRGLSAPEKPFCGIGAVKTNTGHLETAAAMAGIFKVILGMKHDKIPGSIHLNEINPYIQLENTPLYLVNKTRSWERQFDADMRELPRRAGVSSFGFGGVSGHIVIEEFLSSSNGHPEAAEDALEPQIVVLSARNEERLKVYAARLASYLESRVAGQAIPSTSLPADGNFLPLLQQELIHIAATIIDVNDGEFSADEPLADYGFDGIRLTHLLERINEQYDLGLVSISLLEQQSLNAFAAYLWDEYQLQLSSHFRSRQERERHRPSFGDVAYTLQIGREAMSERLAFVATSLNEVIAKLKSYSGDEDTSGQIHRGNVEKTNSALELLLNGTEGAEFIQMLVQGKRLDKLAQLWASGINIDWKTLQTSSRAKRISLPTYPFARDRYWFSESTRKSRTTNTLAAHPLIDQPELSLSLNGALVFSKTLHSSEAIVSQHNVAGQLVLPGVGHVAMAVAALSQVKETESVELNRVLWLRPVVVEGESKQLRVLLREDDGKLEFEVQSGSDTETVKHSSATLRSMPAPAVREQVPVDKIKNRCTAGLEKKALYHKFSERGVKLGNYFQTLERTWTNPEELLAEFCVSPEFDAELKHYFVHPGMMDAALQAIAPLWWARNGENQAPLLPFAIQKVEFLRPLGARGYVYVKAGGEQTFNAALLDESGVVCVKLHEVTLREAVTKAAQPADQFYFQPTWKDATEQVGHLTGAATKRESVLIVKPFSDLDLGAALRTAFADHQVFEVSATDQSALFECLRQMPSIDRIFFLGGIQSQPLQTIDEHQLNDAQNRGLMSLFRLVKSLERCGHARSELRLTVLTNDVHEVVCGQSTRPFAAGIFGFVKSLAKEYPSWSVNCIDISQDDAARPELVEAIVSEPRSENGNEVALRNGSRYVRVLEPLELPPPSGLKFRQHGVYLILGGAGGIGLELSEHLAQTVQARLVLVGRSPLNDQQRRRIEQIESSGARVLYIQADAADLNGMKSAVKQAREVFGPLNGVIHSALVLNDKTIAALTEEEFCLALPSKIQGSVNLHLATANEPLDFLLFFSSAQSFSGNAGQSNYAAGCTFKDAFAEYLRRSVPYDVKTINWGYWGEVGVVASAEYNRRLAAQGVGSISVEEGMPAVHTVLGNRVGQVVAVHGDDRLLAKLGADLQHRIEVYASQQPSIIGLAAQSAAPGVERYEFEGWQQAFEAVEVFGQELLLDAFRQMGVFHRSHETYDREDLKRQLGIVPAHSRLFEALLNILSRAEFIQIVGSRIAGTSELDRFDRGVSLSRRLNELTTAYPQKEAHLKLLSRCLENAPRILKGEIPATEVIFPQSSMDLVTGIYKHNPAADYFNQLVVENVRSYVESRLNSLPEDEEITILEVGAGTGGTSAGLFDGLRNYSHRLRYLYTDISASFTRYGKTHYGAANPYAEFTTLDIEQDIEKQGYKPGSCDVVVATNVLHATSNIAHTLRRVKSLLKTHGWLVINEGTSLQNFATLTFGFLEGWWLFEDATNRLPGSPLLDCDSWKRVLNVEGYDRVVVQGPSYGSALGQNVVVAESNGLVRRPRQTTVATPAVETRVNKPLDKVRQPAPAPKPLAEPRMAAPVAATVVDVRQHVENSIIEALAEVLQLEKDELNLNSSYTSLGIDSILSVEVVNTLNKQLEIDLRSTDLFNYPTVRSLTTHIVASFEPKIRPTIETSSYQDATVETTALESTECDTLFGPPLEPDHLDQPVAEVEPPPLPHAADGNAIAIIGIAGKFPEADNVNEFWSNLASGRNSIREAARWNMDSLYDPDQRNTEKSYAKWAGLLSDIELFDPLFFNLSPKEAEMMDPRQRLFLEEAWKALEDAGYSDKEMEGKNCSVFVGCGPGDYKNKIDEANVVPNPYIFTGNQNSILAARLSYLLNLKGPTVP